MPDGLSSALGRLVGVLGEDALFVMATGARDPEEALEALLQRRGHAYTAAVQGQPHTRITAQFDPWLIEMTRALAPVSPPAWLPMMDVVRERVTLEIGARGLRSLFSSKPSEKDVARVKRYGTLASRTLRAVLAADGPLDREERAFVAALIAALGLPEADANALRGEVPLSAEALDPSGEMDPAVAKAIVRGAWLAAAADAVDPREEQVIHIAANKMGVHPDEVEAERRVALGRTDARRKTGLAAVDAVRYVLSDRIPGSGVTLAALAGTLTLPRRWREEALAPVGHGAPVVLARRHAGLEPDERFSVLGIAWAAALVEDPTMGRRAVLRARWERCADDLGEDDPRPRELLDRWLDGALTGVARNIS